MKTFLLKAVNSLNLYSLFNQYTKNTAIIFMIHGITSSGEFRDGAISIDTLRRYFEYLRNHRYKVMALKDYIDALINHRQTYKTVIFTVDDGYRDFYLNAFPLFQEYDFPATIFITSDFINKRLFFWWDTIEYAINNTSLKELDLGSMNMGKVLISDPAQKSDVIALITKYCKTLPNSEKLNLIENLVNTVGVDISCQPSGPYEPLRWDDIQEMTMDRMDFFPHTKTHPILSKISREQKIIELTEPKGVIESQLKTRADIFCYPNGQWEDFDEETISILKTAGYVAAVTGVDGFDSTMNSTDLFRLRRFGIPSEDIIFKQYICGLEYFKQRLLNK